MTMTTEEFLQVKKLKQETLNKLLRCQGKKDSILQRIKNDFGCESETALSKMLEEISFRYNEKANVVESELKLLKHDFGGLL